MPSGFLTLGDVILPPPLPAVVSILLVAGCYELSDQALRGFRIRTGIVGRASAFIVSAGLVGAMVHALALVHFAGIPVLRSIAGFVLAAGCAAVVRRWHVPVDLAGAVRRFWREGGFAERAALVTVGITVSALFLTACGPVTDIDSLDYHLGVPLDWLRHGGVTLEPYWWHARLIGPGEAINMLGLAAGSDGVGAMFQVSGLLALLFAVQELTKTPKDRAFAWLLVASPVVLQLATAQKPQLFPAAAVVIGTIVALKAESAADFVPAFGCAAVAMSCKYSFLLSGGAVFVIALVRAFGRSQLRFALVLAVAAMVLFVVPVMSRNYRLYGDPVSPFLESFRQHPDAGTVQFAGYLPDAGEPHTFRGVAALVWHCVVPAGPGDFAAVLGIGVFALCFAFGSAWSRPLLMCSAVVATLVIWRGQLAPRFLLEPYLWCALAAAVPRDNAAPWSKLKELFFRGLLAQSCGVAMAALVGATLIAPGALTATLRQRVMESETPGYAQAVWMDRVIPKGERIMVESRGYALFPRPFAIPRCDGCGAGSYFEFAAKDWNGGTGVAVLQYPFEGEPGGDCRVSRLAGPERFLYATRNPFNRREYRAIAVRVDCR